MADDGATIRLDPELTKKLQAIPFGREAYLVRYQVRTDEVVAARIIHRREARGP